MFRNPLEVWGEPSYEDMAIMTSLFKQRTLIANDPGLIRHVLVDNAGNYRMGEIRQLLLRPILRDGLLTAEGDVWKRSRKAMAPVFSPRRIAGFGPAMRTAAAAYADRLEEAARSGAVHDMSRDMTEVTFAILSQTLFSGGIQATSGDFAGDVARLLHTMGRVDPFDFLKLPPWVPRLTRFGGRRMLNHFRDIVDQTMARREAGIASGADVPDDFLTLLLRQEGDGGLTREEIKDNIITFIGAGHETTARALGWTLYCLANSLGDCLAVEAELDQFFAGEVPPPDSWPERLPKTRAAFEEALRLYPPAPAITRLAVADDRYQDLAIPRGTTVLIMPWTLHRHRKLWLEPDAYLPQRFWPENREAIERYQYLPFGAGPRVCIGAAFAMQEAVIVLASLLHRFRFTCTKDCKPWPVQKLTTQPEGGLPMTVSKRH
jgi:cytochrome P450